MVAERYSRPRLAREFNINERTLAWLERTKRIDLSWETENGLFVCSLTEEQRKVLSCSAVAITAFSGVKETGLVWPFQRFLFLRTLQMPIEDQYQELLDRNLIYEISFPKERLQQIRERFISRLPQQLRAIIQEGLSVTEAAKDYLDNVLDICEIKIAYDHPELVQAFDFMPQPLLKECVDCSVSTKSSFEEARAFLLDVVQFRISVEGLAFYQLLFHDVNLLTQEELKGYIKSIKPSAREKLSIALSSTIEEFRLKTGIDDQHDTVKVLSVFKDHLIENLITIVNHKTPEAEKSFHFTLRSLMLVLDKLGKSGRPLEEQNVALPAYFRTLKIEAKPIAQAGIFQLPSANRAEANG